VIVLYGVAVEQGLVFRGIARPIIPVVYVKKIEIPSCLKPLGLGATLGLVLFDEVESELSEDGEIRRRVLWADSAVVFSIGRIRDTMQFIFDAPMTADRLRHLLSGGLLATVDVVSPFFAGL